MGIALVLLVGVSTACGGASAPGVGGPAPVAAPGTVTGQAVDGQGRPLEGVSLWIETEAVYATPHRTVTGSDGRYRVADLSDLSIYKAYAWLQHAYDGQDWCLRLANGDDSQYEPFAGAVGAVRDFRWLIQGPMPDAALAPTEGGASFGRSCGSSPASRTGTMDVCLSSG